MSIESEILTVVLEDLANHPAFTADMVAELRTLFASEKKIKAEQIAAILSKTQHIKPA